MSERAYRERSPRASRFRQSAGQLLLVTLFALPFIAPLWQWSSVPCTHDGHLHYHRVAAIQHAWEHGLYFSRWMPDLAFGYGYPFFIFREPLPLYLTHFFHLAGLPLPAASNLFYALCILASGWFTFLWVRDIFGARAALVAAVAYLSAPYLLVDALVRGNQVESLALALFPLILWAGRRFLLSGRAVWFLTAALGLATLSLSHNISLLIFVPTLLVYLLAVGRLHKLARRHLIVRPALVIGLGLSLTAFYTGSALLEMNEVTLTLSTTTRNNDFRFNFASMAEILSPVAAEDPSLLNPPLLFRLGWIPLGLALIGLLTFFRNRQREQRAHILLMTGAAVIYLFFALSMSRPLWEQLPLIEFVQFPWRFVGRAALPVAMLAGALFTHPPILSARLERALTLFALPAALILLFLEGVPNLYPAICPEDPFPTILTVHRYEHETGLVGVDPEGSYFPRTVLERPTGSVLEADYLADRTPQRFDRAALPADVSVTAAEYGPNRARILVVAGSPFHARYLTFAFPGWQVSVDGQPVAISPSEPEGLLTFPVPAGEHLIEIAWRSTPLRTFLSLISLTALVAVVLAYVILRRDEGGQAAPSDWSVTTIGSGDGLSSRAMLLLAGLALLLLFTKIAWFDRSDSPLRRPSDPPVTQAKDITAGLSGAELRLAGYRVSRDSVPAGETFDIDLAWETLAPPGAAYQSNVWLAGPDGLVWSDKETFRPRIYEDAPATLSRQPGSWAWDSREVQVFTGAPPGLYDLVLTFFPLDTLQPLTLTDGSGAALGPTTNLGQITITRPADPPAFAPQYPLDARTDGLSLLGFSQDRETAAPGDPFLLTLFWERTDAPVSDQMLTLNLVAPDGNIAHQWQIAPALDSYPPGEWEAGERIRGQHLLRLPAHLQSSAYTFRLEDIPLGTVLVNAPERSFAAPETAVTAETQFGEQLVLAGYTLDCSEEAGACRLLLSWRALAEMDESYHVFVHLIDEDGRIIAQSDGQPAGWQRPTTGWVPGEYILDEHTLPLPADAALRLRVGVYHPDTNLRLLTGRGDDAFEIPWLSQRAP